MIQLDWMISWKFSLFSYCFQAKCTCTQTVCFTAHMYFSHDELIEKCFADICVYVEWGFFNFPFLFQYTVISDLSVIYFSVASQFKLSGFYSQYDQVSPTT